MIDILSLGAGVQSTTLLYMSCDGVLPKLADAGIFRGRRGCSGGASACSSGGCASGAMHRRGLFSRCR